MKQKIAFWILPIISSLVVTNKAFAQADQILGVHAAPTFAWGIKEFESVPRKLKVKTGLGCSFGFIFRQSLGNNFFCESGINYSLKTHVVTFNPVAKIITKDGRVELPLLLSFRHPLLKAIFVKYKAGGAIDFFGITDRFIIEAGDSLSQIVSVTDANGDSNVFLIGSIGIEKELKSRNLFFLGISYYHGFNTVDQTVLTHFTRSGTFTYKYKFTGHHLALATRYYFTQNRAKRS